MSDSEKKLLDTLNKIEEVREESFQYFRSCDNCVPRRDSIIRIVRAVQSLMFPRYFPDGEGRGSETVLTEMYNELCEQLRAAFAFADVAEHKDIGALADEFISLIPDIKKLLIKDAQAIYEGDPAAVSPEEVILCYPGFFAICVYRIAHEFYKRKIPFISRLMTEYAHEKTGVDIHAGATIGEYFCIDHGTGIVVGETATIGSHVKIYQGVTIGAKSFEVGDDGNPIKGIKRHPDIGNNVVIYANATILGGRTFIGDGSVIGGNVWITSSVAPGSVVHYGKAKKE